MKERPILFSAPMVRAILGGHKTQTRRILKVQPDFSILKPEFQNPDLWEFRKRFMMYADDWYGHEHAMYRKTEVNPDMPVYQHRSPYGEPGDRLWVRETFAHIYRGNAVPESRHDEDVVYAADGFSADEYIYGSWKPSIHMPRWASRLTLGVTGVRVERLQDISEVDAAAEGVESLRNEGEYWKHYLESTASCDALICLSARESFRTLWDGLNDARGYGWDANPWVWVVEFKQI